MASVQGTPEQVQQVQKLIQEIVEQVIVKRSELHFQGCHDQEKVRETLNFFKVREKSGNFASSEENSYFSVKSWGIRFFLPATRFDNEFLLLVRKCCFKKYF